VISENPLYDYRIDSLVQLDEKVKIGVEVFDPVTKWFRSEYPSVPERVRNKALKKFGISKIDVKIDKDFKEADKS
jgi:hypothetical protein